MCSFGYTKYFEQLLQERKTEFHEKVSPVLVDFVWGPDFFGYEEQTKFVSYKGVLCEQTVLERVVDADRYPQEWKQFMDFQGQFGPYSILPHTIVLDEPGTPTNPIDIEDEAEAECSMGECQDHMFSFVVDAATSFGMPNPSNVAALVMTKCQ